MARRGPALLSSITCSPVGARRTARLIRRSDPEIFRCDLQVRGHRVVDQGAGQAVLGAGDFVFYDPSRPFEVHSAGDPLQRSIVLMFPRGLLPLAADHVCRPAVVPVAGDAGIGALVSSFLLRLAGRLGEDDYGPADRVRLSTAVLDLLATALAGRLGCASSVSAETQRNALLHQIYTFAEQRLGDPELSPGLIAAAHHISIARRIGPRRPAHRRGRTGTEPADGAAGRPPVLRLRPVRAGGCGCRGCSRRRGGRRR